MPQGALGLLGLIVSSSIDEGSGQAKEERQLQDQRLLDLVLTLALRHFHETIPASILSDDDKEKGEPFSFLAFAAHLRP